VAGLGREPDEQRRHALNAVTEADDVAGCYPQLAGDRPDQHGDVMAIADHRCVLKGSCGTHANAEAMGDQTRRDGLVEQCGYIPMGADPGEGDDQVIRVVAAVQ
jgi:hypothetical protein